jgi:adenine/guanine/hypoxanthine permease
MATSVGTQSTSGIDRWFEITKRGSTVGREVRGGIVTFVTMAYIVVLNPLILGFKPDVEGRLLGSIDGSTPNLALIGAMTAIMAGVLTITMGIVGKMPIALAAGLGLNGFVAYTLTNSMTWAQAMGLVVLEGVIILLLVLTGFRRAVFEAVPVALRYAIGVGIGLFITIIGLVDAKVVRPNPNVLVNFGPNGAGLAGWPIFVFCVGLLLMIALLARRTRAALLIGIAVTTALAIVVESIAKIGPFNDGNPDTPINPTGWSLNVPSLPSNFAEVVGVPSFAGLQMPDLTGALAAAPLAAALAVFTLLLSDFFDTMGTVYAIAAEGDLLDEERNVPNLQGVLIVDSIAAAAGGAAGVSSNTSYIESASGVGEGARTGFASLVTGGILLVAAFFTPLVTVIPHEAAAPALVVVGFLMMTQIKNISFDDYAIGIPAFLTIVLMPFTYSIANGIGAGFVSYVLIKVVQGKQRDIHPLLWVVSIAFLAYFAINPIQGWLGL